VDSWACSWASRALLVLRGSTWSGRTSSWAYVTPENSITIKYC
jgi:hypothetical protein